MVSAFIVESDMRKIGRDIGVLNIELALHFPHTAHALLSFDFSTLCICVLYCFDIFTAFL